MIRDLVGGCHWDDCSRLQRSVTDLEFPTGN